MFAWRPQTYKANCSNILVIYSLKKAKVTEFVEVTKWLKLSQQRKESK